VSFFIRDDVSRIGAGKKKKLLQDLKLRNRGVCLQIHLKFLF
jgi:hypothetical protein